jgi:hypothetical protein
MSHPQLFQHVEPNIFGVVMMVTFQKQDLPLVIARQNTLEMEIRQIIADGEEDKIFVDNEEGIWFGGVSKTKTGHILAAQQADRSSLAYTNHISRILKSQPKKRGRGIPISLEKLQKQPVTPPIATPIAPQKTPTSVWTSQQDSTIITKFSGIQLQFAQQHEHNIHFNTRISQLKLTTKTIDNKMDRLLDIFKQDTHRNKIPRTHLGMTDRSGCHTLPSTDTGSTAQS